MTYTATLTSKRQLTIPSELYKRLDLKAGQKLVLTEESGAIKMEKVSDILDRLQGSVKIPPKFKGLAIDEIIEAAKKEYFSKRKNDLP